MTYSRAARKVARSSSISGPLAQVSVASQGTPLRTSNCRCILTARSCSRHRAHAILGRAANTVPSTAVRPRRASASRPWARGKDAAGLAEGAEGGALAAEQLLHLGQATGLLQGAEAGDNGAEETEQEQ